MVDSEFMRIAIFRLEDCARRLLELGEQVQSRALRQRLLTLSRELSKHADALADGGVDPAADG
jgi:hypothetical protein